MKLILFSMLLSVASWAEVDSYQIVPLNTRSITSCDFWNTLSGPGQYGYVCSSYPSRVDVADGFSTQAAIRQLESRILTLESKIKELEAQK